MSDCLQSPIYNKKGLEKANDDLEGLLERLKLSPGGRNPYVTQPQTSLFADLSVLRINEASDDDIVRTVTKLPGFGHKSASKIIVQRMLNGDFLGREDFDRRVKGVSFKRLEALGRSQLIAISFAPSSEQTRRKGRACRHIANNFISSGCRDRIGEASPMVLATWNAGRMSPRGDFYEQKVAHVLRFIQDSDAHVLMLQELSRGVARDLRSRIRGRFGPSWSLYCDSHDQSGRLTSSPTLGLLYRKDVVSVSSLPNLDVSGVDRELARFRRPPQVALIRTENRKEALSFIVVHVHLYQVDPRQEIAALSQIAKQLESQASNCEGGKVKVLLAGDFNLNADSVAFDSLRVHGFVEIIRPPKNSAPHPFDVLGTETTVGGQWYDNFWVGRELRPYIQDAWCFDFGGRAKMLRQSGYDFAAEKRSRSSDHLPVAISFTHA